MVLSNMNRKKNKIALNFLRLPGIKFIVHSIASFYYHQQFLFVHLIVLLHMILWFYLYFLKYYTIPIYWVCMSIDVHILHYICQSFSIFFTFGELNFLYIDLSTSQQTDVNNILASCRFPSHPSRISIYSPQVQI